MATLPVIPTFVDGETNLTHLQQLKYAVSFLIDAQVRPYWHLYKTSNFTTSSAAWSSPQFGTVAFDSDGLQGSGIVTIKTQGIYALESCVQFFTGSTATLVKGSFLITGGASNPHLAPAATIRIGQRGGQSANSSATADAALTPADTTPFALYPGDTVEADVWTGSALTMHTNNNNTYLEGRFAANFTGMWMRAAT